MTLGEKIRHLRAVEGVLRGLERPITQQEMVRAMKKEVGKAVSQAYLSQIESGARPHMTNVTRTLLARFFKVYPGFLVDDPEGYQTGLTWELRTLDAKVDSWLYRGAEQFRNDPEMREALLAVAKCQDSRKCLLLLGEILKTPGLAEQLSQVLRTPAAEVAPPGIDSLTRRP
jgi:transcriptional regulator with XRE-family HTH domain